jgi:hypothetical protein
MSAPNETFETVSVSRYQYDEIAPISRYWYNKTVPVRNNTNINSNVSIPIEKKEILQNSILIEIVSTYIEYTYQSQYKILSILQKFEKH